VEERLQKILARIGVAPRRKAETLIAAGRVSVNGKIVQTLGTKADARHDQIRLDGKLIPADTERVYMVLHKPRGYVTTLHDPQGRPIVTDLIAGIGVRVFPVGRLDYDSEGLLFLTNDGEFAQRVLHPRYGITKTYNVKIQGHLDRDALRSLQAGLDLSDGRFEPLQVVVNKVNPKSTWVTISIHEGRNRLIRHAFASMGHLVRRLIRVSVGDVFLGSLRVGTWRNMTPQEVERLMVRSQMPQIRKKLS